MIWLPLCTFATFKFEPLKKTWKKITSWEQWPFRIIYIPIGFLWMYYALKARAVWFFSNVNPTLEFSGFEGETKMEMYDQLPGSIYPKTILIELGINFEMVVELVNEQGFTFPFIVKPDIGTQGLMVNRIENFDQLKRYHTIAPVNYLVQEFIDMPMEFSVFHIRYPGERKGMVTGFILKEYMGVTGDGKHTLMQLIRKHDKAYHYTQELRKVHATHLETILPKGEKYQLSYKGNHNRGAKFVNLYKEIDEKLCQVFDKISVHAGKFHYGRYDLKSTSIEDLKHGINISIIEFNGVGSEPNHIYDCGMNYAQALNVLFRHWQHMYRIGRINYRSGIPYAKYREGRVQLKRAGIIFKKLRENDGIL